MRDRLALPRYAAARCGAFQGPLALSCLLVAKSPLAYFGTLPSLCRVCGRQREPLLQPGRECPEAAEGAHPGREGAAVPGGDVGTQPWPCTSRAASLSTAGLRSAVHERLHLDVLGLLSLVPFPVCSTRLTTTTASRPCPTRTLTTSRMSWCGRAARWQC